MPVSGDGALNSRYLPQNSVTSLATQPNSQLYGNLMLVSQQEIPRFIRVYSRICPSAKCTFLSMNPSPVPVTALSAFASELCHVPIALLGQYLRMQ
jgi:hypothetical protein